MGRRHGSWLVGHGAAAPLQPTKQPKMPCHQSPPPSDARHAPRGASRHAGGNEGGAAAPRQLTARPSSAWRTPRPPCPSARSTCTSRCTTRSRPARRGGRAPWPLVDAVLSHGCLGLGGCLGGVVGGEKEAAGEGLAVAGAAMASARPSGGCSVPWCRARGTTARALAARRAAGRARSSIQPMARPGLLGRMCRLTAPLLPKPKPKRPKPKRGPNPLLRPRTLVWLV